MLSQESTAGGALLKQGNEPRNRKLWDTGNRKNRRK